MSRQTFRRLYFSVIDAAASVLRRQDDLVPPRNLIDGIGGGSFQGVGREFFRHFTQIGALKPHHRVLDVGCGCGRMAVPMIPFLSDKGEYYGFDIVPAAIKWSQKHIAAQHPRFHFELADIYNKAYNRSGKLKSDEYRFPYQDGFFDFAILTSVFTHMLAGDMEHYLSEIARTLKAGGRCMISFFLLNSDALALIGKGKSAINLKHPLPHCAVSNQKVPEAAVAYEEAFIRERFAKYKLEIIEPIHYGSWPGRDRFLSYQDIILAVKD
ncbi:MAG: class I SAM-dependent methyltransferase [Verrucomicrobiota bacterium]|jgi:SAM-dependent methyltransferase